MDDLTHSPPPSFAVVGAVNHGKSSVVSSLAADNGVRVSPLPGETVECQRIALQDFFAFYDTPGFQNPGEALGELKSAANSAEPLRIFREFVERHRGEANFDAECHLFQPVIEGSGLIYVVDGSHPHEEKNRDEMEILRLTGRPRMAIINCTSADNYVADWKQRLGQHFNAVREFNAHHATFADRIELLETLAGIEQSWKPKLSQAVRLLRQDWEAKIDESAEIIVEMLGEALRRREVSEVIPELPAQRLALKEKLRQKFTESIGKIEARAHGRIIDCFDHERHVKAEANSSGLFAEAIFDDETWKLFGLSESQLIVAATATGAAGGLLVDAALGGSSFGLAALVGGAMGGGGAWITSKRRPEIRVTTPKIDSWLGKILPQTLRLGGAAYVVGPYAAINFPWILLDRALGVFFHVINRAHARRDEMKLSGAKTRQILGKYQLGVADWPEEDRKCGERIFTRIKKDNYRAEDRLELRRLIQIHLKRVAEEKMELDPRLTKN